MLLTALSVVPHRKCAAKMIAAFLCLLAPNASTMRRLTRVSPGRSRFGTGPMRRNVPASAVVASLAYGTAVCAASGLSSAGAVGIVLQAVIPSWVR